jgi:hypothetical protein
MIYSEKDSIIVAADSRSMVYTSDTAYYFTDTTNKIFNVGKFFFVFSGPEGLKGKPLRDIIIQCFDTTKSLKKNCDILSGKIVNEVNSFYKTLTGKQMVFFQGRDMYHYFINLYIVGYEHNKSTIAFIKTNFRKEGDHLVATVSEPDIRSNNKTLEVGGYNDRINNLLNANIYHLSKNRVNDFIKLITIEARHEPQVDSNVNYVVIKSNDIRRGRNY